MMEDSGYLGTRLTRTGTFSCERAVRSLAMRAGWLQFGKYWQSRSPFGITSSLFKGVVQGAALSGLESATGVRGPLAPGEVAPILSPSREVWAGSSKGHREDEHCRGSCKQCQTWSSGADCVVRSQRFTSCGLAGWRGRSGLMVQFAFETQSTLAEDGSPTEHANPWLRELFPDVLSLLFLESAAAALRQVWDRSALSLFGEFAESFWKIDLDEASGNPSRRQWSEIMAKQPCSARQALARARWEAQGGNGAALEERARGHTLEPTRRTTATQPSILLLLEGRVPTSIPPREGIPRRL